MKRGAAGEGRARSGLGVCFVALLAHGQAACGELGTGRSQAAEASPPQSRLTASVYLDEWLELGSARCRVTRAERVLTEPNQAGAPRVQPDLNVLALHTECTTAAGAPLPLESALSNDTLLFLRQGNATRRAPSLRTKLSSFDPAPLVFELADQDPTPARRSFEARSGRALFTPNKDIARLSLEAHGERQEVWLRQHALDDRLDAWLTRLVNALTNNTEPQPPPLSAADLERLRALYASLLERFEPARLSLSELSRAEDGSVGLSLVLERPKAHDAPNIVATLRFELPAAEPQGFAAARLLEVTDGRAALECADKERALRARIPATSSSVPREAYCSLLGLKVPERCEKLDPAFKDEALAHRMRCVPGLSDLVAQGQAPVPDDFQLTLRRGRREGGFDHGARFIVSLFHNGAVVFHGRSFVNGTGRSDGRTSAALLRRLNAQLEKLSWFERRGGSWDAEHCSPEEERGDLFSVVAGGRQRMVVDRDGCRGPFEAKELEDLRRVVELAAGVTGWTRSDPWFDTEGVSEWIVNAD
ncbi:MAG: hypothetical protein QM778_32310 [Myxococcales bacterium]